MSIPALPESVPRRGGALARAVGRAVFAALGWRFEGGVPDVAKCVLIGAPHTSNWDFVVGMAAMLALGLDVRWLGKHTLFREPFGPLLRWLGGIPVDRSAAEGVAERVAAAFAEQERLMIGITPEGTRKRVEKWKTGFHRIARAARVPLFPVAFDYRTRTIVFHQLFTPTDDLEADLRALQALYSAAMARRPENYAVVPTRESDQAQDD